MKKILFTLMTLTAINGFADDFRNVQFKAESGSHVAQISQSYSQTKIVFDKNTTQLPVPFSYENNQLSVINFRILESNPYTYSIDFKSNKLMIKFDEDKGYIVDVITKKHKFNAGTFIYINNFIVDGNKFMATTSKTVGSFDNNYLSSGTIISGICENNYVKINNIGNNDLGSLNVALQTSDGFATNCKSVNGKPQNLLLVDDLELYL